MTRARSTQSGPFRRRSLLVGTVVAATVAGGALVTVDYAAAASPTRSEVVCEVLSSGTTTRGASLGPATSCTLVAVPESLEPTPSPTAAPTQPTVSPSTSPTTSPTATPTTSPPSSPVETARRDATLWPFSPSSPWNTPIGSEAAYESATAPRTARLLDSRVGVSVNAGSWSHPLVRGASSDPLATVTPTYVQSLSGWAGWVDAPRGTTASYRIPVGSRPALPDALVPASDRHLHVIDPTNRYVDETWNMVRQSDTSWSAGFHARVDLQGSGVGAGGARAYGGSAIGGLLRDAELRAGSVPHAVAVALSPEQLGRGFVWPAISEDGDSATSYKGVVPIGSLVAIPRSIDLAALGLTPTGLAVARALQGYGGYVVDRADNIAFYAEPSLEGSAALAALRGDAAKIRAQLRLVTNSTAAAVGGPGTRIAPTAPPLS